jgi:cytochrome c biogenesis protein
VWLTPEGDASKAQMALSTNRKTMDGDKEFEMLKTKLLGIPMPASTA